MTDGRRRLGASVDQLSFGQRGRPGQASERANGDSSGCISAICQLDTTGKAQPVVRAGPEHVRVQPYASMEQRLPNWSAAAGQVKVTPRHAFAISNNRLASVCVPLGAGPGARQPHDLPGRSAPIWSAQPADLTPPNGPSATAAQRKELH